MIPVFLKSCFVLPLIIFLQWDISKDIRQEIEQAIKEGNAKKIAAYFGDYVSITLKDDAQYYSKYQAEMVLKDFLRANKAVEVKQVEGITKSGSHHYILYEFSSSSRSFRVFVRFTQESERTMISELRIE